MDIFDIIRNWVVGQVGAQSLSGDKPEAQSLSVDTLGRRSGAVGLFPQGVKCLRLWEDLLGNRKRRARYSFLLRLHLPPGESAARNLLCLQLSAAFSPPEIGENQHFEASEGRLLKGGSEGLAIYELRLTAEREELL